MREIRVIDRIKKESEKIESEAERERGEEKMT